MENHNSAERTSPIQFVRNSRAFRQFKNPPQPHMCIQDTIKNTSEKLYINVLGWQKIANPKQYSDPIPLYGGMQVSQGCGPTTNKPALLVFAVMVNPDILRANGKNAVNALDREALVSLLCDFVEAMNPGLLLSRNPVILKDRDLAGELKDVWLAVQNKREREKGLSQDIMYKVYDIDGVGNDDFVEDEKHNTPRSENDNNKCISNSQNKDLEIKLSVNPKQNQLSGQKHAESELSNCQIDQNSMTNDSEKSLKTADTTYCMSVHSQIVSSRENHNQINDIQDKFASHENVKPSTSYKKDSDSSRKATEGWSDCSKRDITLIKSNEQNKSKTKPDKSKKCDVQMNNGKSHFDFFPMFDNKTESITNAVTRETKQIDTKTKVSDAKKDNEKSKIIIEPMQKLVLHSTDNKICDNKTSALSSISS